MHNELGIASKRHWVSEGIVACFSAYTDENNLPEQMLSGLCVSVNGGSNVVVDGCLVFVSPSHPDIVDTYTCL